MSEEHRLTDIGSGVRVVTEAVPSVRSVALGLWVRTGSRDETPAQAGVSLREPVRTQSPSATDRTEGTSSVTTRTPEPIAVTVGALNA